MWWWNAAPIAAESAVVAPEVVEVVDAHLWNLGRTEASRARGRRLRVLPGVPVSLESVHPIPRGCSATLDLMTTVTQHHVADDVCVQVAVAAQTQDRTVVVDGSPKVYGGSTLPTPARVAELDGVQWSCGRKARASFRGTMRFGAEDRTSDLAVTALPRQASLAGRDPGPRLAGTRRPRRPASDFGVLEVSVRLVSLTVSCPEPPAPTCDGGDPGVPKCGRCWLGAVPVERVVPDPRSIADDSGFGRTLRTHYTADSEYTLVREVNRPTFLLHEEARDGDELCMFGRPAPKYLGYEERPYMAEPYCCGHTAMPMGSPKYWGPDPCAAPPWPEHR